MSTLSGEQLLVLNAISRRGGTATPTILAQTLGKSWQGVTRTAVSLVNDGLVARTRLPKATYYEMTPDGRAALEASCPST